MKPIKPNRLSTLAARVLAPMAQGFSPASMKFIVNLIPNPPKTTKFLILTFFLNEKWQHFENPPFMIHSKLMRFLNQIDMKLCFYTYWQEAKKARLEKFEIPAKIKLLSNPWTPESGLVTAALKLKRDVIRKAFSEDLSKLYAWNDDDVDVLCTTWRLRLVGCPTLLIFSIL